MKRIIFYSLLAFTLGHGYVKAQMVINVVNTSEVLNAEPVDDALFTIQYHTTFLHDISKPESRQEESMVLKVGKKLSQYYSYSKFLTDSIIEIDKKNGASQETIIEHLQKYSPKIVAQVYKNYPSGKVTTLDRLGMSNFKCEETNEKPEWKILPDTMTVASYNCQKAVCSFKGRQFEAWFTTEIPRSEGPWKLHGLPGLILKAEDSEGHYTFECSGIIQNQPEEKIFYVGNDYQPITRKDLNKLYERFAADPVGFISATAPHVKIRIQDQDGQPTKNPKNTPFNPIELAEK